MRHIDPPPWAVQALYPLRADEELRQEPCRPSGCQAPPHNLDAERALLGAVLLRNEGFFDASAIVSACDFYRAAHTKIFLAMAILADRGEAIDLVTLRDQLTQSGGFDDVGGAADISSLVDGIIKEKSKLRAAISALNSAPTGGVGHARPPPQQWRS